MKVFMIGGTGLLGSEAARELIARGHEVTALALPPVPKGATLPPEMKVGFGNYLEMSDDEMRSHLRSCDAFVFAAGVDERVEGPAPQAPSATRQGVRRQARCHLRQLLRLRCQEVAADAAHEVAPLHQEPHRPGERRYGRCRTRL